jgi:hypothetical protein
MVRRGEIFFFFFFFLRPRDMGLAGNPHRHPLHAAFCKHDWEQKFETNLNSLRGEISVESPRCSNRTTFCTLPPITTKGTYAGKDHNPAYQRWQGILYIHILHSVVNERVELSWPRGRKFCDCAPVIAFTVPISTLCRRLERWCCF